MMKSLVCGIFLVLVSTIVADDEKARLLASKNILNMYIVENKDLTVEYQIYNVGGSSAVDAELVDETFPSEDFETLHGSLSVKWKRIGPGSNVSHVVILKPLRAGYFNFSSAELHYYPSENAREMQKAYTSAPGEGGVVSFKDYDRKFSSHGLDWAAFAVMTLPSLGIPFLLWRRSKSKYENLKLANKKTT